MSAHKNEPLPADACPTDEVDPHETREEIISNRNLCVKICVWLGVLTIVTVAVALIPFSMTGHIIVALLIATIKAALVVMFFMHFLHEKWTIYQTMILTMIFAFVLFALTYMAKSDPITLPYDVYGGETTTSASH